MGEDVFANYIFKRSGAALKKVAELEGDVYLLTDNKLVLQVLAGDNCFGHVVAGELSLFNLEQGDAVYTHNFSPVGESLIGAEFRDESGEDEVVVLFTVESEAPQGDEYQDAIGRPVERILREFQLYCADNARECTLTKLSGERSENMTYIGGCD